MLCPVQLSPTTFQNDSWSCKQGQSQTSLHEVVTVIWALLFEATIPSLWSNSRKAWSRSCIEARPPSVHRVPAWWYVRRMSQLSSGWCDTPFCGTRRCADFLYGLLQLDSMIPSSLFLCIHSFRPSAVHSFHALITSLLLLIHNFSSSSPPVEPEIYDFVPATMPPLPHFDSAALRTLFPRSISTQHRPSAPGMTAWIVIIALLFMALMVTACFTTYHIMKQSMQRVHETATAPPPIIEEHKPSITTVANSNWARKDSNVLWSAYFCEDDLKSQFGRKPSQMSRLYSVGSIESDVCPLEKEADEVLPPPPHNSEADVRSRATYTVETTPTKNLGMGVRDFANFEDINIKGFIADRSIAAF